MKSLINKINEAIVKKSRTTEYSGYKFGDTPEKLVGTVGHNGVVRNKRKWPQEVINMINDITDSGAYSGEDLEQRLWKETPYADDVDKYYNIICAVCDPKKVMDVFSLARSGKHHKIEVVVQIADIYMYSL